MVAGAVAVLVLLAQVAVGIFSARNAGSAFGSALVPWLIVSLIAFYSSKRWHWGVVVGTYLGAWLVLSLMSVAGRAAGGA